MNHKDIINLWPSLTEFAADMGVPYPTASAWKQRNYIPAKRWPRLLSAALVRRFWVTPQHLMGPTEEREAA